MWILQTRPRKLSSLHWTSRSRFWLSALIFATLFAHRLTHCMVSVFDICPVIGLVCNCQWLLIKACLSQINPCLFRLQRNFSSIHHQLFNHWIHVKFYTEKNNSFNIAINTINTDSNNLFCKSFSFFPVYGLSLFLFVFFFLVSFLSFFFNHPYAEINILNLTPSTDPLNI